MSATIGSPPPTFALNLNNGELAASAPVLQAGQTWNNATETFTAFKVNVTDNASAAASLLADLKVGGVSKFSVRKDGRFTAGEFVGLGSISSVGNVNATDFLWSKHATQGVYFGATQDAAINRVSAGRLKVINGTTGDPGKLDVEELISTGPVSAGSNVNTTDFLWSKHATQGVYFGATQDAAINRVSAGRLKVINGTTGDPGVLETRLQLATAAAPAAATDPGVAGETRWDANYIYVCIAANTWKRTALATW